MNNFKISKSNDWFLDSLWTEKAKSGENIVCDEWFNKLYLQLLLKKHTATVSANLSALISYTSLQCDQLLPLKWSIQMSTNQWSNTTKNVPNINLDN